MGTESVRGVHTLLAICSSSEVGSGECVWVWNSVNIGLALEFQDVHTAIVSDDRNACQKGCLEVCGFRRCLREAYVGVYFRFGCL
jgi:hypothetical protein